VTSNLTPAVTRKAMFAGGARAVKEKGHLFVLDALIFNIGVCF
jgi:hypothetical protein